MLGQRRRRWASINTTLVQCLVFAGVVTGCAAQSQKAASVIFTSEHLLSFYFAKRSTVYECMCKCDRVLYQRDINYVLWPIRNIAIGHIRNSQIYAAQQTDKSTGPLSV